MKLGVPEVVEEEEVIIIVNDTFIQPSQREVNNITHNRPVLKLGLTALINYIDPIGNLEIKFNSNVLTLHNYSLINDELLSLKILQYSEV